MNDSNLFNSNDIFELFIIFSLITLVASLPFIGGCLKPMAVSPKTIHFAEGEDLKFFEVYQKSFFNRKIAFSVEPKVPWLKVTPTYGILGRDNRVKVQVYLDRNYSEGQKKEYPPFATGQIIVSSYFQKEEVTITTAPDYYTEIFEGDVDLSQKNLIFTPDKSINFYKLEVKQISSLPNEVLDEEKITFSQDNTYEYTFQETQTVSLYGKGYNKIFISAYGWIGFGEKKKSPPTPEITLQCGSFNNLGKNYSEGWNELLAYHFSTPNITAFPVDATKGGSVYLKVLQNKVVITYIDVPTSDNHESEVNNTFQIEIYQTGKIALNYLTVDAKAVGIVGLSYGIGELKIPEEFVESDLVHL